MCHHELLPTSVSHPFSLNSSLDFAGGKHYQKITIPIFRLVLQNFAIPDYFPSILFCHYLFSLLSSGWFVIAVRGSFSVRELVKYLGLFHFWCRVDISNDKSTEWVHSLFTPQPSGLEGYCRHGPGGRAGGCQTWTHISVTAWWIFSVRSSVELPGPVVVHCHGHSLIWPIWTKNLSNQAALGPDFAEPLSLKPLDGFIPFEVLWNCLDL